MKIKWPEPFPGAYWLDEREENAVLDVLRRRSLFRYYGLNKPKYAADAGADRVQVLRRQARPGRQQRHRGLWLPP